MSKTCKRCGLTKPLDAFGSKKGSRDGLQYWCKPCVSARFREWEAENPERVEATRKRRRATVLRKQYGITDAEHEAMLIVQDGRCAICRRSSQGDSRGTQLHVDHCHVTGAVRGLLCGDCNRGLGLFGDDIARMRAAIQYLEYQSEHLRVRASLPA